MANEPLQVKPAAPTPVGSTDVFRSFRNEMDRLFDRFTTGFGMPSFPFFRSEAAAAVALPAVDISEDTEAYRIAAELPGMSEKDIEIALNGDTLVLKGEKRQESESKEKDYYLAERSYGAFQRAFALPDGIDRDKISAEFNKGVLHLTLPKTPAAQQQQKKIDIKTTAT